MNEIKSEINKNNENKPKLLEDGMTYVDDENNKVKIPKITKVSEKNYERYIPPDGK